MTAHSAYFRAGDLYVGGTGGTLPSLSGLRGAASYGWQGLSRAPLPAGDHTLDPGTAVHGLGFHPTSVKTARDFAKLVLRSWGLADLFTDVRLVVSELVTNACRHAAPNAAGMLSEWSIQFGMVRQESRLVCMVFDPSSRVPTPDTPGQLTEGGRGLCLIESFSADWGWELLEGQGKVVWAAFTLPDQS